MYTERRRRLRELVGKGPILLPGNAESSMNYAANVYPFRQDSTFLYYFGLDRPGLVGVIDDEDVIYGDDISLDDLVWTGPVEPLAEQAARVGVRRVRPLRELSVSNALTLPGYRPEHTLQGKPSIDLIRAVVAMRSIKDAAEIAEIEKAVNVTNTMQLAAISGARSWMTEAKVAGMLQAIAIGEGGNLAFPTILTTNGQILHNHYGPYPLAQGRMVLCDCGAEGPSHYSGDLTRTFPVDPQFTSIQRDVYQIVLDAHLAAVSVLKPGIPYKDVHLLACKRLFLGLQALGLTRGDADSAVAAGAHALFFQCGLGHMLGLDTHDMENLGEAYVGYTETLRKSTQFGLKSLRLGRPLEAGFVITVEPGLYFIPELIESWAAQGLHKEYINYDKVRMFAGFGGIRIEEDFLITPDGARLLGEPLPKTIPEIEALRAG
jgi:Xaa-Pro aminopeptidase